MRDAFTALDGRLTALQTQIGAVESRLQTQIDSLRAHIDAVEHRFGERLEATETKLLTAFHNWASPNEARQRTHAAALRAIDLEMEALSERVSKLEQKPPQ
jgi:flagellin-like hook-associated protein FlgL